MKYTRIEIESTEGRATVRRDGDAIVIKMFTRAKDGKPPVRELRVNAGLVGFEMGYDDDDAHLYLAACTLQKALDGTRGTNGDVHGYRCVIDHFAD